MRKRVLDHTKESTDHIKESTDHNKESTDREKRIATGKVSLKLTVRGLFNTPDISQGDKRSPDVACRRARQVACNRKPKGVSPNTRRQVPDMLHGGGGTGQPTSWHNVHNKTGQWVSKTRGCDQKRARHLRNLPQERFTRQMPGEEEVA